MVAGHHLDSPVEKVVLKPTVSNPIWWLVNQVVRNPDITVETITLTNLETQNETVLCPEGRPYLSMSQDNSNVILTTTACLPPPPPTNNQILNTTFSNVPIV